LPPKDLPRPLDMRAALYFCVLFEVLCDWRLLNLGVQFAWNGVHLA